MDIVLRQTRDQRVVTPREACNCCLASAAVFLAANGIVQAYNEPFGIGPGSGEADPKVACGVAFGAGAAEAFKQPFLFERMTFLDRFPAAKPRPEK